MAPDDIPTSVTELIYSAPFKNQLSQNNVAELLAHFWPAVETHIREQVALDIETHTGRAPWGLSEGPIVLGAWIDSRDGRQAAHIARNGAGR